MSDLKLQASCLLGYAQAMTNLSLLVKSSGISKTLIEISEIVAASFQLGGKLLLLGNGGSHCSALHIGEEFTGRFRKDRKPLPALTLGEATHASCVSNDFGSHMVFQRQLDAFLRPKDVVLYLSTSGVSENLIQAHSQVQNREGIRFLAFLGGTGGILGSRPEILSILVPGTTTDRIQELHMLLGHLLVELVERQIFPDLYADPSVLRG